VSAGTFKWERHGERLGAFSWSGGALTESGSSTPPAAEPSSAAQVKDISGGRILNTAGASRGPGSGAIRMGTGAVIHNSGRGTRRPTPDQQDSRGAALFDNTASGTFLRGAGTGTMKSRGRRHERRASGCRPARCSSARRTPDRRLAIARRRRRARERAAGDSGGSLAGSGTVTGT